MKQIRLDLLNERAGVEHSTIWTYKDANVIEIVYKRAKDFINDMWELGKLLQKVIYIERKNK